MKTASPSALALLLFAVLAISAGCHTAQHEVNTVETANPSYVRRNIEDKRIIRDPELARSVAVVNVIEGTTPDGLMRVGVEVQNLRRTSFRFNYRFDWFDNQGFPINTPTATMVSQQIEGGQILVLDSVAPTPGTRDFRLTVQKSTRDYTPILRKN
jgi:uncharacterized protein YcfL